MEFLNYWFRLTVSCPIPFPFTSQSYVYVKELNYHYFSILGAIAPACLAFLHLASNISFFWTLCDLLVSLNSDTLNRAQYLRCAWIGQSTVLIYYHTYTNAVNVYIRYFSCSITWAIHNYPIQSTNSSEMLHEGIQTQAIF